MLFLLISCPLLLVPPEHFRKPFVLTAITSTVTCFSIFFWSIGKGHGLGPLVKSDSAAILGVEPAKGSRLTWMIFYGISSQIGSWCAGVSPALHHQASLLTWRSSTCLTTHASP